MSLLEIRDVETRYSTLRGDVLAVDHANLKIEKGESFGLAGESGCGKTTLALSITRLLPRNGKIVGGEILFDGCDIAGLDEKTFRRDYRWKRLSIVFQGAMNALDPVYKVGDQIAEAITTHESTIKPFALQRAAELLQLVGVDPERAKSFPHELSGGMRQRVMIAMALACNPQFVIADEPVTALDVIVRAQVIKLIKKLQQDLKLSMMLITHDLSVISEACEAAAIMYAGDVVEYADIVTIFKNPAHPYTKGLVNSFPSLRGERRSFTSISGNPPNLLNPPPGCKFHLRCPYAKEICKKSKPSPIQLGQRHFVACHLQG